MDWQQQQREQQERLRRQREERERQQRWIDDQNRRSFREWTERRAKARQARRSQENQQAQPGAVATAPAPDGGVERAEWVRSFRARRDAATAASHLSVAEPEAPPADHLGTGEPHRSPPPGARRSRKPLALVAVLIAAGAGGVAAWQLLSAGVSGTVSVGANVRSGPSQQFGIIGGLPVGRQVKVNCIVQANGGWAKLASPHEGGFVAQRLLRLDAAPESC